MGAVRHQPRGDLPLEDLPPGFIPALIEGAGVAADVLGRRMMGRMHRARGPIHQERLVGIAGPQAANELDGLVRQVGGQEVVRVAGAWGDGGMVRPKAGQEVVRLAAEEAVEALEALAGGPGVEGASDAGLGERRLIPFAQGIGGVALVAQDSGEGGGAGRHPPVVAGEAGRRHDVAAHRNRMVVAPGQQGHPGRGAQGHGMEVGVGQPALRQALHIGRPDQAAVGFKLGEPGIVEQPDQNVRRSFRRGRAGGPGRHGFIPAAPDQAGKGRGRRSIGRRRLRLGAAGHHQQRRAEDGKPKPPNCQRLRPRPGKVEQSCVYASFHK